MSAQFAGANAGDVPLAELSDAVVVGEVSGQSCGDAEVEEVADHPVVSGVGDVVYASSLRETSLAP